MPDSQPYRLKLCLITNELDINVYNVENRLFSIVDSLQNDLRITAGKHLGNIRTRHF